MDATNVVSIISTVGFPIAMCLLMGWYIKEQQKLHKEEIDKMSDAVNNNTLVVQKLLDKFDEKE